MAVMQVGPAATLKDYWGGGGYYNNGWGNGWGNSWGQSWQQPTNNINNKCAALPAGGALLAHAGTLSMAFGKEGAAADCVHVSES